MIKNQTQFIIILFFIVVISIFTYSHVVKTRRTPNYIDSNTKIEVERFIQAHLLSNLSGDKIPEKYSHLSDETIYHFSKLQHGLAFAEKGQIEKAWHVWDYCLNDQRSNKFLAETYYIIGLSLGERDAKTSLILLQKALEITRSSTGDDRIMEYCCLNGLIRLLVNQAEYDNLTKDIDKLAMQYSLEAHRILSDSTFKYNERNASTSIYRLATESLYWLGEDSLANYYVEQLLKHKKTYEQPELVEGYVNILHGVKAYVDKDYKLAEYYFKNSISNIASLTSHLNYDLELPYAYLGSIYKKKGCYDKAIEFMSKSIKALQNDYYADIEDPLRQIDPNVMKGKRHTYNIVLCYLRLQYYYKEAIKTKETTFNRYQLTELTEYTNHLIKSWFLNAADEETLLWATKLIKRSNANAVDIIFSHKDNFENAEDQVFSLQTEASSFYLNYLIELKKEENISKSKSQYNVISELSLDLMKAEADSKELQDEYIQKRLLLLHLKSELWDEQREELSDLVFNHNLPKNIAKNEAVIKFFMSYTDFYITYFTAGKRGILKLEKADFFDQLKQFKYAFKSGKPTEKEQRFFYDLLIKPIQQDIKGVTKLTILSDERLEGMPFEILMNEKDEVLINNYAIKYTYSSKNINEETKPNIDSFLALAPGFEKKGLFNKKNFIGEDNSKRDSFIYNKNKKIILTPISSSIEEVKEVGQLFERKKLSNTVFTSRRATKRNFIKYLKMHKILHIATHGISNNEFESGLFFSKGLCDNGFLSLQELYGLEINADLVVLSACKTGVGVIEEGEGVMALPRGFIYAGAPNVIASLWKVNDEKTKELMITFYYYLLEEQVSYAEALRLAKIDCIQKGFLPLDWAGFVLIGV